MNSMITSFLNLAKNVQLSMLSNLILAEMALFFCNFVGLRKTIFKHSLD